MNRAEFMERLQELLEDIPQEEREDALQYYNDYLDDAGAENENAALAALGSPERIADSIRIGLQDGEDFGEFTEEGFQMDEGEKREPVPVSGWMEKTDEEKADPEGKSNAGNGFHSGMGNGAADPGMNGYGGSGPERPKKRGVGEVILLILACLFLLPILIPVGLGAVIIAFVFLVCVLVFFACLVIGGITVLAVGGALVVFAVANLAAFPASAVCILGGGLVCVGIGLLLTLLMCWLAAKTVPALCRGFVNLCSLPFRRKNREA